MEIGRFGITLNEEDERLAWARANTFADAPLSDADLDAILAEHTETVKTSEPVGMKIPATHYERASSILARYVSYGSQNQAILDAETRQSIPVAQAILQAIDVNLPSLGSANNPSA